MASNKSGSPKENKARKDGDNEDVTEHSGDSEIEQSEDVSEYERSPGHMSSEGENTLKKRKNQSGDEEFSDGGSPSPLGDNEADDEKGSKFNVMFWGLLGLVLAAGLLGLYYSGQTDSVASSHPLMVDVAGLLKKFNLSNAIEKNMMATFGEMVSNQRPVVVMVASSDPGSSNSAVSQCLFKSLSEKFGSRFKQQNQEAKKIVLQTALASVKEQCAKDDVSRCVANKFVELFRSSLKTTGVLWLDGIEALNYEPGIIVSMNSFADHSEAPFKQALIFITATIEADGKKSASTQVKSYFQKMWTKNSKGCKVGDIACMTSDNFHAVWTRIGDFIIDAKGLSSLPEFC